jgi:hypothetical protein
MVRSILHGVQAVHLVLFLAGAVGYVVFWVRTELWLPKYIHFFAIASAVIMIWFETHAATDSPISHANWAIKFLFVLSLPAIVYAFFLFYGGQHAAFKRSFITCGFCKERVAISGIIPIENSRDDSLSGRCPHCGQELKLDMPSIDPEEKC